MSPKNHTLRVEALVLRHADWGEADRLLTIYSREAGKLRCLAKGARKLRSRKAGHLEPFTRVALLLAQGRDLWIIDQAETVDAYLPLTLDLLRTGYASYVVELLDRFTFEEGEHRGIYFLVVETLQRLCSDTDPFITMRFYEIHLLDLLGFRPQLFRCVRCGEEIRPQDQFFSAIQGGVVCPKDGMSVEGARPVSREALRFLRHLQRSGWTAALRADPPAAVRAEMEALLQFYLTFLLERSLNSPRFIREVRKDYRGEHAGNDASGIPG